MPVSKFSLMLRPPSCVRFPARVPISRLTSLLLARRREAIRSSSAGGSYAPLAQNTPNATQNKDNAGNMSTAVALCFRDNAPSSEQALAMVAPPGAPAAKRPCINGAGTGAGAAAVASVAPSGH